MKRIGLVLLCLLTLTTLAFAAEKTAPTAKDQVVDSTCKCTS